jgi:predicted lipoprotein with Yx(FWY)xxD motif
MKRITTYTGIAALAATLALLVSACGGGGSSSAMGNGQGTASGNDQVSVSDVSGVGDVLVDAKGNALYMAEQEADGMVLCTNGCTAFWKPLTVTGSTSPIGASSVDGSLGTVERPDGSHQITFDGAPLYRFTGDSGPGNVSGDGFADSFDGRQFNWHVARPGGATEAPRTPSGGTGSYGGSGY